MSRPQIQCAHCGYEIETFVEALEAMESGAHCLLCSQDLDAIALSKAVDGWDDGDLLQEGEKRATDETEVAEEDALFEGVPDFGDEGEDDEEDL